jgi:hypothetical protein
MTAGVTDRIGRRYGCIRGAVLYGAITVTGFMAACNATTGLVKGDLEPSDIWKSRPPIVRTAMGGIDDWVDKKWDIKPYRGPRREDHDDPWDAVGWAAIGAGILLVTEEQRRVRCERRGNPEWYRPSEWWRYSWTGQHAQAVGSYVRKKIGGG